MVRGTSEACIRGRVYWSAGFEAGFQWAEVFVDRLNLGAGEGADSRPTSMALGRMFTFGTSFSLTLGEGERPGGPRELKEAV